MKRITAALSLLLAACSPQLDQIYTETSPIQIACRNSHGCTDENNDYQYADGEVLSVSLGAASSGDRSVVAESEDGLLEFAVSINGGAGWKVEAEVIGESGIPTPISGFTVEETQSIQELLEEIDNRFLFRKVLPSAVEMKPQEEDRQWSYWRGPQSISIYPRSREFGPSWIEHGVAVASGLHLAWISGEVLVGVVDGQEYRSVGPDYATREDGSFDECFPIYYSPSTAACYQGKEYDSSHSLAFAYGTAAQEKWEEAGRPDNSAFAALGAGVRVPLAESINSIFAFTFAAYIGRYPDQLPHSVCGSVTGGVRWVDGSGNACLNSERLDAISQYDFYGYIRDHS
jgi:hypothetical protein